MTLAVQPAAHRSLVPARRIHPGQVPSRALAWFLAITLAITWGIAGSYIFFPDAMAALFGAMEGAHPLYFVATWGPGIAGIVLVLAYGGRTGLRAYLKRLFRARAGFGWWLLVLAGVPASFMIGSLLKGGPLLAPMDDGAGQMLVISLVMLFLGPIEEFGWRGVAQPLLQRHLAPIWAGALIGAVWGLRHLPAFSLSGTVYTEWNFPLFLAGCITIAILVTPIFNAARGGLLLPMLLHWQLILPIWPDAQPWDTWILMAITLVVVWVNRSTMFSRQGAVTDVIPQD